MVIYYKNCCVNLEKDYDDCIACEGRYVQAVYYITDLSDGGYEVFTENTENGLVNWYITPSND